MSSRARVPDQVTVAFGSDPARELVWTWRTSPEVTSTAIRIARLPKGPSREPLDRTEPDNGRDVRVVTGESTLRRSSQPAQ